MLDLQGVLDSLEARGSARVSVTVALVLDDGSASPVLEVTDHLLFSSGAAADIKPDGELGVTVTLVNPKELFKEALHIFLDQHTFRAAWWASAETLVLDWGALRGEVVFGS